MARRPNKARQSILERRTRFIAAAIAGLGLSASVGACSGETSGEEPGQGGPADSGDRVEGGGDGEAGPQPCLSPPEDAGVDAEAGPQVCLEPPLDAGADAEPKLDAGDDGADAEPQPCLSPLPPDGG